jgi:bifunctional UDP-N-acetylglucosamine pyrophosphorylase/glucosamine-1-phosphate N-acetyltransferase
MAITQVIILAAGESSRFWPLNYQHKSLLKVMGKPLIWYTLDGLREAGMKDIIIVQGPQRDIQRTLKNYISPNLKIRYIVQKRPKGMGDALFQARNLLKDRFFLVNPERFDAPDYIKLLKSEKAPLVLFSVKTTTPHLYGILELRGNKVVRIVEKPKPGKEPSNLKVAGLYLLSKEFFNYYKKVKGHPYDFEDTLNLLIKYQGAKLVKMKNEELTLKYPWHLFSVFQYLMQKYLRSKISKTAAISKDAVIKGPCYIGEGVKIFEGAVIKGPCYIGDDCMVGTNSVVRDYTNLENAVWIGALTEVTRSIFQEDAHCHSGFFGDSIFGESYRAGAGTVTANVRLDRGEIYTKLKIKNEKLKINTGLTSLGAVVGRNTNIGINVSLMPGVLIGSNCVVGPHSLVRENIEDNKTFFTQFKDIKK